jgi:hypothetical protein
VNCPSQAKTRLEWDQSELLMPGELMRKFEVWQLAMLLHHIDHSIEVTKPMAEDTELRDEKLDVENVSAWIEGNILLAQIISKEIGLDSTHKRVWEGGGPFWMKSRVGITWQEACSELRVLRQCVEADLEDKWFAFVLPEKAALLVTAKKDWARVLKAIPNTTDDIREALYCYALERDTASVFHLMRAAEWGLRAFCSHFGFKKVRNFVKKNQRVEYTPIEYEVWEKILNQLRPKVDKKLNSLKKGSNKQVKQEFYNSILAEIEAFKGAWRNHVMHSRRHYSAEDAKSIMSHVKRFLDTLAGNGVTQI